MNIFEETIVVISVLFSMLLLVCFAEKKEAD
jgi:hypothetical protein